MSLMKLFFLYIMSSYNFMDELQNDKIKSSLIKVQALQKEYEVTLQQYQEAVQNFIINLQSNSSLKNEKNVFTALKGRSWWGATGLSEGSVSTQKECENMCANSSKCSGATFNPVKRYCWTRSGESMITAGRDDDYALITQQKTALSVMKYLNQRLLDLNREITNELKNIGPEIKEQYDEKNIKQKQLASSYVHLLEQKIAVDKELREYYSIDEEENNQSMYVNQQNMSFRIWRLIACLVLLLMIYQFFSEYLPPISTTNWVLTITILTILTYTSSYPASFIMILILLLVIFLIKSSNLLIL
jgi:hypothetical protein